jgi:hypothetical protein
MKTTPVLKSAAGAPGEGERRAMRGYVSQYELAARLIYEAIAAGHLRWIGLADRSAGDFDDIVLGLEDGVIGYQLKTKRDPEAFHLRTLLLGAAKLGERLLISWRQLKSEYPDLPIKVTFVADDFPHARDNLLGGSRKRGTSSAALLRTHAAHGADWSLREWRNSEFGPFIDEIATGLKLADDEFEAFWRSVAFIVGGAGRHAGSAAATRYDERRLNDLFALLPRLVADPSDNDTWTLDELLQRLGWQDLINLRHEHVFPTDSFVQANRSTEDMLQKALTLAHSGYVALLGPPGSGKSTLLQSGLLPTPRAVVIRYLAFVPNEGQGLGRAEAADFLHDLVTQLNKQNLGQPIIPGSELPELQRQFAALLLAASERYRKSTIKTIIVVDGLDHVPREERPEHSLLRAFPIASAVPLGVTFVLGTQRLDLPGLPPSIRDQALQDGRRVDITPLAREAVHRLAVLAGVEAVEDHQAIFDRSEGHPLSVRYLIEGVLRAESEAAKTKLLTEGPSYGRNVEAFYEMAWHDLENQREARLALAYLALAEGALDPLQLDRVIGSSATDATWDAASHLLRIDASNRWSIFHNSFRLYLLEKTSLRFGKSDVTAVKERYRELAELAKLSSLNDPQRWMELRYRARAEDHLDVLLLATPRRFRQQLMEGRNPGDIQADIRLCFSATRVLRNTDKLFELILCQHEILLRADALESEDLVESYIASGQLDAALGLINSDGVSLPVSAPYLVIDALLQAGRAHDARELFEASEPIGKLLGSEPVDLGYSDRELYDWARRALIFREPRHFLASLDRLQLADTRWQSEVDLDSVKSELKLLAAQGVIGSAPTSEITAVAELLHLGQASLPRLLLLAAEIAFDLDLDTITAKHLQRASANVIDLSNNSRRRATRMALELDDRKLAIAFFDSLTPPTLMSSGHRGLVSDWMEPTCREIILHAALEKRLGICASGREYSEERVLNALQRHLEDLGRLGGAAKIGLLSEPDVFWHQITPLITLVQHGVGDDPLGRFELDYALPVVASSVVRIAALHGDAALRRTLEGLDELLRSNPQHLGDPRFIRPFAMTAFAFENETQKAVSRLQGAKPSGHENTPHEYIQGVALTASALAKVGAVESSRQLLREMHNSALGVSLPPRRTHNTSCGRSSSIAPVMKTRLARQTA